MGLIIRLINHLIRLLLCFILFAALIALVPNLPPYTPFTAIKLAPTQKRVGPLAPNGALNDVEKLYKDKLLGPEAFQLYNGEVYTSLATGEIVKVSPGGHVTFVTKVGQPCSGLVHEHICGRPLGFEIDEKTNTLYVADAYYGIWKIDLKTDKKQLLVSPHVSIEGRKPKLFNSLALAKNGDIYWTDSTSDFQLKDGAIALLSDPSGRLFYYSAVHNQSKVLVDDLWIANGVVISPDHQFLLVVETNRNRILKYYIEGPKKGMSEVFVDGLPGTPDNIRSLPDGSGVLIALYMTFDDEHPHLLKSMSETPLVRKFLARIQRLLEIPIEYLNKFYPHIILEEIIYIIGNFRSLSSFTTGMSGLVQVGWDGKILASYYNIDGTLGHISDAIVYNGKLYTGAPHVQNFIGSVTAPSLLVKAFNGAKNVESQEEPRASKPVTQTEQKAADVKIDTSKQSEPKLTPKPDAKPTPKLEPKPTPKPEEKTTLKGEVKLTPKTDTKPSSKPEVNPTPKSGAKPTPKPEVKPMLKSETKPTPKPQDKPMPKPETKPTPKPEAKPTPKLDDKPTPKTETKPSPKPVDKTTPKPETKPTPKSETQPTPKPEAKPTPKPETKPAPKSETQPIPKPEAKPTPKLETQPTPKTEAKPMPKLETIPTPKPDDKPTPKPDTKPTPKPEAKSMPKPETKPTPNPQAEPTPQYETKPSLKSTPKPAPEVPTTPMAKATDTKHITEKPITTKQPTSQESQQKKPDSSKPPKEAKQEIPIKEEIPSDTAKPNKDTLKVIKKGGPAEIPNPNLV